jgi:hypothetical protein
MRLTTLLPHPSLRPFVLRYLIVEAELLSPLEQCVSPPDGAVLIVVLQGTYQTGVLGATIEPVPSAFLMGRYDRAVPSVLAGRLRAFMVQFAATGSYRLLGPGIRELTNHCSDLGAVEGWDLREWAATLADLPDHAARATATGQVLLSRLHGSSLRPHALRVLETATAACGLIERSSGRMSVEALARQLHTTPRTTKAPRRATAPARRKCSPFSSEHGTESERASATWSSPRGISMYRISDSWMSVRRSGAWKCGLPQNTLRLIREPASSSPYVARRLCFE